MEEGCSRGEESLGAVTAVVVFVLGGVVLEGDDDEEEVKPTHSSKPGAGVMEIPSCPSLACQPSPSNEAAVTASSALRPVPKSTRVHRIGPSSVQTSSGAVHAGNMCVYTCICACIKYIFIYMFVCVGVWSKSKTTLNSDLQCDTCVFFFKKG